jgi:YHS domain-containing protein
VLPSDIIITPQGQLIEKMNGATGLPQYLARLNQVAAVAGNRGGGRYGQPTPSGPPMAAHEQVAARPAQIPTYQQQEYGPKSPPASSDDRYNRRGPGETSPAGPGYAGPLTAQHGGPIAANHGVMRPGIPGAQAPTTPQAQPPAVQLPAGNPPLGLDGYCPVRLAEETRWVLGDVRWGLIHRGRTYLFAGPEERDRFDVAPNRYAPALSGNDPVLAVERGEMVPGRRQFGAWFEKQVYLFSSETTFQKFNADPYRYVSALQRNEQPNPNTAQYPAGPSQGRAGVPGSSRY